MKVTRLGSPRPILNSGIGPNAGSFVPAGGSDLQVLTSNGSNGRYWGENVARITANGTTAAIGPYVNFAAGSNTTVSVASNTILIHASSGGVAVQDEGSPLATSADTFNFVGAGVVASGGGATKTITISGTSGGGGSGSVPTGLIAGDQYPGTPGAEDQEFEGTADALPTDYAWLAEPTVWSINSAYPSWFIWERAASNTTEYKLRISNFAMAATSGLWIKMGNGTHNSAVCQFEWIIYDSTSSNGYGAGVHNGKTWVARDSNAGVLANRGTNALDNFKGYHAYIGVVRVSDTWTTYLSADGVNWMCIQTADTRAFTVARLEFRWSADAGGGAYLSRASVDWIRYRADNLFPRP